MTREYMDDVRYNDSGNEVTILRKKRMPQSRFIYADGMRHEGEPQSRAFELRDETMEDGRACRVVDFGSTHSLGSTDIGTLLSIIKRAKSEKVPVRLYLNDPVLAALVCGLRIPDLPNVRVYQHGDAIGPA
jgi:hypothetical protein